MRQEIDPYVDLRCNHGYTFEMWLMRGHTVDEYRRELAASGDEAWLYHNERGVWWTAEWSRLINGLYLWAGPFKAHIPWTYQSAKGNPFDDTDGGRRAHDWGLAFPDPADRYRLVPTRVYECMREGYDDVRYLATLEAALAKHGAGKPGEAKEARAFLARLRRLVEGARPTDKAAQAPKQRTRGKPDLDSPVLLSTQWKSTTAAESPLINALSIRFDGHDLNAIRTETIRLTRALMAE